MTPMNFKEQIQLTHTIKLMKKKKKKKTTTLGAMATNLPEQITILTSTKTMIMEWVIFKVTDPKVCLKKAPRKTQDLSKKKDNHLLIIQPIKRKV